MTGFTSHPARRALGVAVLAALALCAAPAFAADPGEATASAPAATAAAPSNTTANMRLIEGFFYDPAIANQWWEAQFRVQNGAFPPIQDADGMKLGGVVAINVFKNVELGGQVFWADYDLDHSFTQNGNTFDGESGATDLDLFGKYRFMDGDFQFAVGGELTLPTGSEDDGLGTGAVTPAIFGAVRGDLSSNQTGTFTGVAHLGFRFNGDPEFFGSDAFDGKTSVFVGAGVLVKLNDTFGWTAELNMETERFDVDNSNFEGDSDIRLTGGAHWDFRKNHLLRGGASFGLADGAPDFEVIASYVYHF